MQLLCGISLFTSALLLFIVEPLFSKTLLPSYGGTPAVWSTCLVLFQTTLFCGYLYAHLLASRAKALWLQALIHLGITWAGLALLSVGAMSASANNPVLAIGAAFLGSIGLPFFVLSATTPLLQRWYHQVVGKQPYFFYAVSNAGSFVALIGYPLAVEPLQALSDQRSSWLVGYGLCATLISLFAVLAAVMARRLAASAPALSEEKQLDRPTWQLRLSWLALALVPSGMLVGATSHITTDVAAIPLLWVVPLALYLMTFILVFASRSLVKHAWMLWLQPFTVLPILVLYLVGRRTVLWIDLPLHLTALFVASMVCHGELVRKKPPASQLTEFYLWISAGGCLGGILTALAAPQLFDGVVEYPLMIIAACLARPAGQRRRATGILVAFFAAIAVALLLTPVALSAEQPQTRLLIGTLTLVLVTAIIGALLFHFLTTRRRVAVVLGAFLGCGLLVADASWDVLYEERGFFGTLRVVVSDNQRFFLLMHGMTLHGAQRRNGEQQQVPEPLTYFSRKGPLGDLVSELQRRQPRMNVAVFGLGVGTIAAYARANDRIVFYEIDPGVVDVAQRPAWFSFLQRCRGRVRVVTQDARLALSEAADGAFSLIVEDAFSSDAIPTHLLTREAFELYLRKLGAGGVLAFHITNRQVDLEPVLAELAAGQRLVGLLRRHSDPRGVLRKEQIYPSTWAAIARQTSDLGELSEKAGWRPLRRKPGSRVWTDDYSALLPHIKRPW